MTTITLELPDWDENSIKVGDVFAFEDEAYVFEGWEFGTYPFARNVVTGDQLELPG